MSEILETRENISHDVHKIRDIPHYPPFKEIVGEITHSELLEMAGEYYRIVVELEGGVIDE